MFWRWHHHSGFVWLFLIPSPPLSLRTEVYGGDFVIKVLSYYQSHFDTLGPQLLACLSLGHVVPTSSFLFPFVNQPNPFRDASRPHLSKLSPRRFWWTSAFEAPSSLCFLVDLDRFFQSWSLEVRQEKPSQPWSPAVTLTFMPFPKLGLPSVSYVDPVLTCMKDASSWH